MAIMITTILLGVGVIWYSNRVRKYS